MPYMIAQYRTHSQGTDIAVPYLIGVGRARMIESRCNSKHSTFPFLGGSLQSESVGLEY